MLLSACTGLPGIGPDRVPGVINRTSRRPATVLILRYFVSIASFISGRSANRVGTAGWPALRADRFEIDADRFESFQGSRQSLFYKTSPPANIMRHGHRRASLLSWLFRLLLRLARMPTRTRRVLWQQRNVPFSAFPTYLGTAPVHGPAYESRLASQQICFCLW